MTYRAVYAEDIETYGISATGSVGQLNWATEVSYRDNAALNSDGQLDIGLTTRDDSLLARGKTFHANLSGIYMMQPTFLWNGGTFLFELAYNNRLEIDKNEAAVAQNTTEDAWSMRMLFEPSYFQVFSGLDLTVPIGFGWNFSGRSSSIGFYQKNTSEAGDVSIGLNLTYLNVWKTGISYVNYWGSESKQALADRDTISCYISRTF
jgi:hypothetical protein